MTAPLPEFAYMDRHDLVPSEMRVEISQYGDARAAEARREALGEVIALRYAQEATGEESWQALEDYLAAIVALKGTT